MLHRCPSNTTIFAGVSIFARPSRWGCLRETQGLGLIQTEEEISYYMHRPDFLYRGHAALDPFILANRGKRYAGFLGRENA